MHPVCIKKNCDHIRQKMVGVVGVWGSVLAKDGGGKLVCLHNLGV